MGTLVHVAMTFNISWTNSKELKVVKKSATPSWLTDKIATFPSCPEAMHQAMYLLSLNYQTSHLFSSHSSRELLKPKLWKETGWFRSCMLGSNARVGINKYKTC